MTVKQKAEQLASILVDEQQNPQPLVDLLINMANWQRKQDKILEKRMETNYAMGFEAHKQLMLKNAVSGTVEFVERDGMCKPTILYEPNPNNKLQLGEKVKIIILKE